MREIALILILCLCPLAGCAETKDVVDSEPAGTEDKADAISITASTGGPLSLEPPTRDPARGGMTIPRPGSAGHEVGFGPALENPRLIDGKCPFCVKEGKTSRVYPTRPFNYIGKGDTMTAMALVEYYDEQGRCHHSDPNGYSVFYRCSNNHMWSEYHKWED